jgi:hypothetical protein
MAAEQLEQLSARHAEFTTTATHVQHPRNDYDPCRHDWAELNHLVEELNRLVKPHNHPPG